MYTYLAELAFSMYQSGVASLDDSEMRGFHQVHLEKFGIPIDYSDFMFDLDRIGILRIGNGQISFRDKYSYWFFVSWYVSENINDSASLTVVDQLCDQLHHEDSANILVFLSHFSKHPYIITRILQTAQGFFEDSEAAVLDPKTDLSMLQVVDQEDVKMILPSTDPEENYRQMLEKRDEQFGDRELSTTDGRSVEPVAPKRSDDNYQRFIDDVRGSVRTIDILGQILRNSVGRLDVPEKLKVVGEVYRLARRINGRVISSIPENFEEIIVGLNEHFHETHASDTIAQRIDRIANHLVGHLTFLAYALSKRVSHAIAHEHLDHVFNLALDEDCCLPNRMYDLSSRLDLAQGVPVNKASKLYDDAKGNVIVRNATRSLVASYLYLHRVDHATRQKLSEKLGIEYHSSVHNPAQKRLKIKTNQETKKTKRKNKGRRRKKGR